MSELVKERLTASQRSRIRRLSAPKELAADEEGGELNIVPFLDIVMNVLMFVLATVSVTFTATIDSTPPRAAGAGARGPVPQTLSLTVLVVAEGFSVKTSLGGLGTGCTGLGSGITVPKTATSEYDYAALTRCASRLKAEAPAFKDEMQVVISANPQIAYQNVVGAIDALRKNEAGDDLFPEIQFGVAR